MTSCRETYDCDVLIAEVENRPALYDSSLEEYNDINYKAELWDEICAVVVNNWNELDESMKTQKGDEIQKTWKAICDCYRKESFFEKNELQVKSKTRKTFLYFDQLEFLLTSVDALDQSPFYITPHADEETDIDPFIIDALQQQKQQDDTNTFDNALTDLFQEDIKSSHEIDEDTAFVLALLPTLKGFKENEKFTVRMEIMKTIENMHKSLHKPSDIIFLSDSSDTD